MGDKKKREETAVAGWSPFGDLEPWPSLLGEGPFSSRFPRLVDQMLRESPWTGGARGGLLPAIDVSEDDDHYVITAELPGTRKGDVHVELHEGTLSIRGEKKSEREEKKEQRRYVERSYGSFSRALRLPPDADAEHLDASFKDGVLTITVPKSERAKPRTIAIK